MNRSQSRATTRAPTIGPVARARRLPSRGRSWIDRSVRPKRLARLVIPSVSPVPAFAYSHRARQTCATRLNHPESRVSLI